MANRRNDDDNPSAALVALAGWLVPGGGYWLLRQRARALAVGLTVLLTFLAGLLLGGVRVIQVPRYDDRGRPNGGDLLREIAAKPWSITQVLAGPVAIAGGAASVWASRTPEGAGYGAEPRGALVHSRINEIAVLYTAVAGMLNLLAMIDASHRANADESFPRPGSEAAAPPAPATTPPGAGPNAPPAPAVPPPPPPYPPSAAGQVVRPVPLPPDNRA